MADRAFTDVDDAQEASQQVKFSKWKVLLPGVKRAVTNCW
jgi:hypothetical protein